MESITKIDRRKFLSTSILTAGFCMMGGLFDTLNQTLGLSYGTVSADTLQKEEIMNKTKCKITILKKMMNQDLAKEFCQETVTPCPVFQEGQVFIYDHFGEGTKPANFCEHAWNDIYKFVITLASGGTFLGWMKQDQTGIACCTDGIRPVVFKLEMI